jgi:hypothetical protein
MPDEGVLEDQAQSLNKSAGPSNTLIRPIGHLLPQAGEGKAMQ